MENIFEKIINFLFFRMLHIESKIRCIIFLKLAFTVKFHVVETSNFTDKFVFVILVFCLVFWKKRWNQNSTSACTHFHLLFFFDFFLNVKWSDEQHWMNDYVMNDVNILGICFLFIYPTYLAIKLITDATNVIFNFFSLFVFFGSLFFCILFKFGRSSLMHVSGLFTVFEDLIDGNLFNLAHSFLSLLVNYEVFEFEVFECCMKCVCVCD